MSQKDELHELRSQLTQRNEQIDRLTRLIENLAINAATSPPVTGASTVAPQKSRRQNRRSMRAHVVDRQAQQQHASSLVDDKVPIMDASSSIALDGGVGNYADIDAQLDADDDDGSDHESTSSAFFCVLRLFSDTYRPVTHRPITNEQSRQRGEQVVGRGGGDWVCRQGG
jgi:hypothetical protein